jgi:hypothetical protein
MEGWFEVEWQDEWKGCGALQGLGGWRGYVGESFGGDI